MAKAVVRMLPFEMALLYLIEFTFLFLLVFAMPPVGGEPTLALPAHVASSGFLLAGVLAVTAVGTAAAIGLYRHDVCLDPKRVLLSGMIAVLLACPPILLVCDACRVDLNGGQIVWLGRLLALWLTFLLLDRLAFSAFFAHAPVKRRLLIVGTGAQADRLRRCLASQRHAPFKEVSIADLQRPGGLWAVAASRVGWLASFRSETRLWGIVIAGDAPSAEIRETLFDKKLRGIPVYNALSFQERHLGRVELDAIDADWLLCADGFGNGALSRAIKRSVDVIVGAGLLIASLPVMAITAVLIKMESPGPIFYRQERTGLHGVPFTLFKFRSMVTDAEVAGRPQWAQRHDRRVTRVGGFIRACRIDELPQLINVLRGEMSLIGPRPERPVFVDELAKVIPFYNHRAYVKPGLTGWAQVNFPYGASIEDAREKLAYDLFYVKNRGLLLDLVILLSTIRVVLFREGAR